MSDIRWGYASSKDAEGWTGCYLTREEAIEDGRSDYSYLTEHGRQYDGFWIHSGHLLSVETVLPDVDDLLERMGETAYDEAGEVAEDYPDVTNEARIELEGLLRGWVEKHALPTFWVADGEAEFIPALAAPPEGKP